MRYLILAAALAASPAFGQNIDRKPETVEPTTYVALMQSDIPVTAADITDRPYRVIKDLKVQVRRAFIWNDDPDRSKIYKELWEEASEKGADAVVLATYGEMHTNFFTGPQLTAKGQAIKFLTENEIADWEAKRQGSDE